MADWTNDESGRGSPWQGSGAHAGIPPQEGRPSATILAAVARLLQEGKPDGSYTLPGCSVEISGDQIRIETDGG